MFEPQPSIKSLLAPKGMIISTPLNLVQCKCSTNKVNEINETNKHFLHVYVQLGHFSLNNYYTRTWIK